MKFFLPYWEDWVHKDFDPITDTYSGGYENSLFAHEIFKPPPYDGLLLSLGMFEFKLKLLKVNGRPTIRGYESVKEYLRVDSLGLPVMGDCGAFTYVNEKEPLLTVDEAVKTYSLLGFDYGISVDHICSEVILVEEGKEELFSYRSKKRSRGKLKLELSEDELEFRRQISLENGEEFLKKAKGFHPVGAAQGYSVETYTDSVGKLIDMGYDFIALGGLVPRRTEFIAELLLTLKEKGLLNRAKFHLLGVLRRELLPLMRDLSIYSFDSASYLRKAWLKATKNYLGVDGNWYSSIRIPDCKNPRLRNKARELPVNVEEMERRILKGLREYDRGELKDYGELLEEIIAYDRLFLRNEFREEKYRELYRELLESKIWKRCNCPVCKELGIDVVIFRGANRNKRRGFHNTFVFYRELQEMKTVNLPSL